MLILKGLEKVYEILVSFVGFYPYIKRTSQEVIYERTQVTKYELILIPSTQQLAEGIKYCRLSIIYSLKEIIDLNIGRSSTIIGLRC